MMSELHPEVQGITIGPNNEAVSKDRGRRVMKLKALEEAQSEMIG